MMRQTYRQEWPAYNQAQTNEKSRFLELLYELCNGVVEPPQRMGRPRMPFSDMLFCAAYKIYSTFSSRRFTGDLQIARERGLIASVPHFNTVSKYLEDAALTPYLKQLIVEASLPLRAIEWDFAVDSSGFSTGRTDRWVDTKWDKVRRQYGAEAKTINTKDWLKVHVMCGVKTNVVTAVEVTDSNAGDSPQFKPLVEATAQNFAMRQVSADRAYLADKNLRAVTEKAAMPYIPFKSDSVAHKKHHSKLWNQMFHYYSYNQERFMRNYHKRSNVETTFHMVKAKFGDSLRSKTKRAQINEALCKVLCHNICCLIQSMYELGLKPKFWKVAA